MLRRTFVLAIAMTVALLALGLIGRGSVLAQETPEADPTATPTPMPTPTPHVSSIHPTGGPPGAQVSLNGEGFGDSQPSNSQITIDQTPYVDPKGIDWNASEVKFHLPTVQASGTAWPDGGQTIRIGLEIEGTAVPPGEMSFRVDPGFKAEPAWQDYAAGAAALVLLLGVLRLLGGPDSIRNIAIGHDGLASTSKLQWALWTGVVLFAYVAIYSARAWEGDFSVISDIPSNVLLALGLSATTMAGAKAITVNYVGNGRIDKPSEGKVAKTSGLAAIFEDDDGVPDLSKIQIMGWTVVALGAFLINVAHQIHGIHDRSATDFSLPDIDTSLMVLMGLSQGSYIGKKLVTSNPIKMMTKTPMVVGTVGANYEVLLEAAGGTLPYAWKIVGNLPDGLKLDDAGNGIISGTPTTAGTKAFRIQIKDTSDLPSIEFPFTLQIVDPLQITTASALPAGTAGAPYKAQLAATGGTPPKATGGAPPYKWSTVDPLPARLALDATTGVLSGTPAAAGVYEIRVQVADPSGTPPAEQTFTLAIAEPLQITTTSPLPAATAGTPYEAPLIASGGTPSYSWTAVDALPDWLALDGTTGVLSGTPTVAGTAEFKVQVSDAGGAPPVQQQFKLDIGEPLETKTTSPLPAGTVGEAYEKQLEASGGTLPYSWTAVDALPDWLALNATGVLSGTPTVAGTNDFTVQVADTSGNQPVKLPLTLVVADVVADPLQITTASPLPAGTVNAPYETKLQASGGTAPYTWQSLGALPAGLALDAATGIISGTPTAAGSTDFRVKVTDAGGASSEEQPFTLVINEGPQQ